MTDEWRQGGVELGGLVVGNSWLIYFRGLFYFSLPASVCCCSRYESVLMLAG